MQKKNYFLIVCFKIPISFQSSKANMIALNLSKYFKSLIRLLIKIFSLKIILSNVELNFILYKLPPFNEAKRKLSCQFLENLLGTLLHLS